MQMSYPLDETLYTASYPQLWLSTRTNGVFSSDIDLICTVDEYMKIIISPGIAWLSPERFMGAVFGNTENETFELSIGNSVLHRIDRVVLRWDFIGNLISLSIKQGIASSNPVPPALKRDVEAFELGLHDISVRAGTVNLTQANITDLRLNENLCGIMRDGVTGIPTQALYDTWYSWFNSLKRDAETKSSEFISWMNLFKTQNETELAEWVIGFKQRHETNANEWFSFFTDFNINRVNSFLTETEADILAWFEDLQNTLDENQAANLFNKIDRHERLNVFANSDGVHGIRFVDGNFQVWIGTGWATLATVIFGLRWDYIDSRNLTWQEWDVLNYTWDEFEALVETDR